jgi:orotate phosphoribosyltransferase
MPDSRSRLAEIVRSEALMRGEFKLSSGGTSNVYLDCRRATLHPEGAFLTASLLLDWIEATGIGVDCVGGPTLGADPIVGAMVATSFHRGRPLPGFLVRKEAKIHGTGALLEGQYRPGWRALIVEDTTTTGRSLLHGIHAAEAAGLHVVAAACLVDRGEATAAALAGYRFHSIFRFEDIA